MEIPGNSAGWQLNGYLLVLQPHEDLRQRIMAVKKRFAESYDCPLASATKPHVTLVNFSQYQLMEEKIVHRLKRIVSRHAPFTVELRDFGSFPSHTIYLEVATRNAIVALVKELRTMQAMLKPDKEHAPHFITEPHLTIARKLLPWQYEKGWLELSNTPFTGTFVADRLLLLKKKAGEKKYQPPLPMAFLNRKTELRQGSLY